MTHALAPDDPRLFALATDITLWAQALGFQQVGITDIDLTSEKPRLEQWLEKGYQGSMAWLNDHQDKRLDPSRLLADCCRVISVRMDYLPSDSDHIKTLSDSSSAYISRYALGRDYHKLMRRRLADLAEKIRSEAASWIDIHQRPFVDSAPVLERPLAVKAGLGWIGKHTLVINKNAGSWFFLGEILTNIPLPINQIFSANHCGKCSACLTVCPTNAFPAPYQLDARRCISYLTIENKGPIPEEFRVAIGNRVFGCDDCQIMCPWNRFAKPTAETDFRPRHNLHNSQLVELFLWSEATFLKKTEGSPIRRIGYQRWLRNLAIGLGNAPSDVRIIEALNLRREASTPLVQEHIDWALRRQQEWPKSPHPPAKFRYKRADKP